MQVSSVSTFVVLYSRLGIALGLLVGNGPHEGTNQVILATRVHAQVVNLAAQNEINGHLGGTVDRGLWRSQHATSASAYLLHGCMRHHPETVRVVNRKPDALVAIAQLREAVVKGERAEDARGHDRLGNGRRVNALGDLEEV